MGKPYTCWFMLKGRLKWHFYLRWTREFRSVRLDAEKLVKEALRLDNDETVEEKHTPPQMG